MTDIKTIRETRGRTVNEMKQMLERAENERRPLRADEEQRYQKLNGVLDELDAAEERANAAAELEKRLSATVVGGEAEYRYNPQGSGTRNAFNRYLAEGPHALSPSEFRALSAGSGPGGGYLQTPVEVAKDLIRGLEDELHVMRLAKIYTLPRAETLGIPQLAAEIADADWTSELQTGEEDHTMAFGRRDLTPKPLAKRIKVSNTLLRCAEIAPETLVHQSMLFKFGVTLEKAFLTGDGVGKPLGVFVASGDGIPTSRDVSTSNTTTAITADGLIHALYALKSQYVRRSTWLFSRPAISMIRRLKDNNNQYLWQAGLAGNAPSTILERPYLISEYAPATFTTGQYVGLVGDFSFYHVAISLNLQIQRLVELYAEQNQTGFVARLEIDGAPALGEAFARVTLA